MKNSRKKKSHKKCSDTGSFKHLVKNKNLNTRNFHKYKILKKSTFLKISLSYSKKFESWNLCPAFIRQENQSIFFKNAMPLMLKKKDEFFKIVTCKDIWDLKKKIMYLVLFWRRSNLEIEDSSLCWVRLRRSFSHEFYQTQKRLNDFLAIKMIIAPSGYNLYPRQRDTVKSCLTNTKKLLNSSKVRNVSQNTWLGRYWFETYTYLGVSWTTLQIDVIYSKSEQSVNS